MGGSEEMKEKQGETFGLQPCNRFLPPGQEPCGNPEGLASSAVATASGVDGAVDG